ncbi:hypothetical protein Gotri_014178 [Gossypium trilobum]|uniref:Uncharacterized protein n=1 Tax=Gossypium trilobum TaxID=34281 RepID=A0A7J9DWC6_9ROSI|nr:hypothetical protein [Gossypium trilobum]PPD94547.1 hypothetical protein GOBAR_DD08416 [Gossypium barbadense]PPD94555.1 hypothetical protein GOBAR_DD08424 [Gossypium barbadense]
MEISLESGGDGNHLEVDDGEGSQEDVDRNTKKEETNGEANTEMTVDPRPTPNLSWKDKLMGIGTGNIAKTAMTNSGMGDDDDLEFLEGDINRSTINGFLQ